MLGRCVCSGVDENGALRSTRRVFFFIHFFFSCVGLGLSGTIAQTSAGYIRNYLIPNGMGVWATPANLKKYAKLLRHPDSTEVRVEVRPLCVLIVMCTIVILLREIIMTLSHLKYY